ncbi:acetyl-CoA hydrolase/transferase family protein [Campylobacter hyointestinalis]|uniref:acetyl-CoA hydrolase/transferase family protein n=1 Tax=Campylobacter hyointestinalis TaxID=198 RepID=UPI0025553824|nr:acetyl-CoA hydrolase/transferase family protein [Campylobacter hyointestinalis]MDL2346948.1 acetyl-CoA hydrolase/transferase family protein [Campylobacter hyointestinalis]MDL2348440.1 acetyl-CoA hydrolase/transferase family protein [Campylobacter hyointestinalis]MDL2350435.1 acetyl-CoA hydrolase/transferase family protein [Campylobacter hyointestinalis]MDM1026016.1 acetyl-CoA hydrolase/transferase family protein [Campylobacter hyointestinalis]MDM1027191.1 acetyl-CoA hydrolase/transferase fa
MIDNTITDTSRIKDARFLSKIIKADEAAALIGDGSTVGFSGFVGAGSPLYVPLAIAKKAENLHELGKPYKINIYSGASTDVDLDGALARAKAVGFRTPFNTDPNMRACINSGETKYLDVHLSSLAWQVEAGYFGNMDFAVIEISGITENGELIPTTSVGNNQAWLNYADKIILELNIHQPKELDGFHDVYLQPLPPHRDPIPLKTARDRIGTPYMKVDFSKVVGIVLSSTEDRLNKFTPLDDISIAIGDHVVDFLKMEETAGRLPKGKLLPLQSGIGNVANAVLAGLQRAGYRGLDCYSEVIQDGMLELIKNGVVDFASASALSLSPDGVKDFRANVEFYKEHIVLRPQEISNSPEVIRRLGVIAMNGMLEADIYGNVNSTNVMGTQIMNGIGGSGDFARNGYLSIFLTPSMAKGGAISAIVPFVSHLDHTEHDSMVIVTEYGFADLRGLSPKERAKKMIAIAHPDYRQMLQDYFDRACIEPKAGHTPHILSEALSWHDRYKKTGTMKI